MPKNETKRLLATLLLAMAAGTIILAIAFIDERVMELRGQRIQPGSDEMLRNE